MGLTEGMSVGVADGRRVVGEELGTSVGLSEGAGVGSKGRMSVKERFWNWDSNSNLEARLV